ncbi:uncharacterized protein F5891DRAFT_1149741 [Suillus fuscotomentosus]|uniref:Uncharacterized protein n=1 Tax=Suillus fuscotomentosus TaxID=1912939 RepID=A0AAD4HIC3_9AGAM|nr:uncharacterized protein F5891DRAFT_1149741 [Suillus fuscotomentosus]KAG1897266.1 hypothetical protein F5891DRAFT_1149741 [Suillus fuscotomentosus]
MYYIIYRFGRQWYLHPVCQGCWGSQHLVRISSTQLHFRYLSVVHIRALIFFCNSLQILHVYRVHLDTWSMM